eukprot:6176061-Pleurochrysis_carterae.AAC.1
MVEQIVLDEYTLCLPRRHPQSDVQPCFNLFRQSRRGARAIELARGGSFEINARALVEPCPVDVCAQRVS